MARSAVVQGSTRKFTHGLDFNEENIFRPIPKL